MSSKTRPYEPRFSSAVAALFVLAGCSSDNAGRPSPDPGTGGAAGAPASTTGGAPSAGSGGTQSGGAPTTGGVAGHGTDSGVAGSGGTFANGGATTMTGGAVGSGGIVDAGSDAARGGAGGIAASGGASGASGAGGAGGAGCVTAGTELCDDFESGHIDSLKWQTPKPSNNVTVTVDEMHAHSGKYAVHVHGVAGQINNGVIAEAVTFPAKSNSFYARIFAYFYPDLPAAQGGDFHTGFIVGSGKNDLGTVQAGMGLIGGEKQYLGYSIFYGPPSYEFGPWANTHAAAGKWECLELFEDGSSPSTEIRKVWVNDKELTELQSDSAKAGGTDHPNHKPPTFDLVTVGLWEFHPSPTLTDMWLDDVRVSSKKIGCGN
jgi:hypothetical protein